MKALIKVYSCTMRLKSLWGVKQNFQSSIPIEVRGVIVKGSCLQFSLNALDLIAVSFVGLIGALGVNYVSAIPLPEYVINIIRFLNFEEYTNLQIITFLGISVILIFTLKTLGSIYISRRILLRLLSAQNLAEKNNLELFANSNYKWIRGIKNEEFSFSFVEGMNSRFLFIPLSFISISADLALVFSLLLLLFLLNPVTTLVAIIIFGTFFLFLYGKINRRASIYGSEYADASIFSRQILNEFISSFKEIRVNQLSQKYLDALVTLMNSQSSSAGKSLWVQTTPKQLIELGAILGLAAITVTEILMSDATKGFSTLLVFLAGSSRITPALMRIQSSSLVIRSNSEAAARYSNLIQIISNQQRAVKKITQEHSPSTQLVSLEKVSFGFDDDLLVLDDVNFVIHPGDKIALLGKSGAGKTTLIDLILGLYVPNNGSISGSLTSSESYKKPEILYLSQNSRLPQAKLIDLITGWRKPDEIDQERFQFAINLVGLNEVINEQVNSLIENRDTYTLSGGELQKVNLARAVYLSPSMLILDESSNALDSASETKVLKYLNSVEYPSAVVTIAHRFSTIQFSERFVLVEKGKVVEVGAIKDDASFEKLFRN
jgi:ABC-type bacteriocin/lantibiotic exporter with double-glycine peptidase domain